jgi:hypothetical protein
MEYTTALCGDCCIKWGITPEIADKIMRIDKQFGNPASIWEASSAEVVDWMWDCAKSGVDASETSEESADWIAARRLVHAHNVLWFGSEILLR